MQVIEVAVGIRPVLWTPESLRFNSRGFFFFQIHVIDVLSVQCLGTLLSMHLTVGLVSLSIIWRNFTEQRIQARKGRGPSLLYTPS
jgi:hypothetical protein